jgi:cell division initiation protein
MKITPIDIRQQQFRRALRGLDAREVDSFLNLVSDELEGLSRENHKFKEELARTQRIVDEYRERERALKETMITAQRITDDIKESARREAEVIISRAEIQAEKIVHAANDRLVKVIEDIQEMKRERDQLRSNLVGIIEAHRKQVHELHESLAEGLFLSVEELRQRRNRLHAEMQAMLGAHADLLGLDKDKEVEGLREEVERLRALQTNLVSRLSGAIDTHSKMLEVREESERGGRAGVEDTLRVLRKSEDKSAPAERAAERAGKENSG